MLVINKLTDSVTSLVRISSESNLASAECEVVSYGAVGLISANSNARICTFVPDARFILRTVIIHDTFRFAASVRISEIFWQTDASTRAISLFAFRIRSTRTRITRVPDFNSMRRRWRGLGASRKGITHISSLANT
jgi:hypothetical protein